MRRVANPDNPYAHFSVELLGEPPAAKVEVYEETAVSILSENKSPDIPFRWGLNPYRGCQHACAYCYARPTHEYLGYGAGTDFETRIVAKVNAPELLETALSRRSWRGESITFSGVTDCYQPFEAVYTLTRRCLEVCARRRNPVSIVTKSYLVTRDIDVLAPLAADGLARVFVSIPFSDDEPARIVEPGAPRPSRRFEAVRLMAEAGIPVGVMVAPVIPGLSDRQIARVLERAAEAGARSAAFIPLRLPGSVRAVFLERIRDALPDAARRVESLVRDMRGGALNDSRFGHRFQGQGAYWAAVDEMFRKTAARLGLDSREDRDAAIGAATEGSASPPPSVKKLPTQLPLWADLDAE